MEGNTEFQRPQKPRQENIKPEDQSLEAAEGGWLRRLKARFNRVFSKEEKLRGEPKIEIEIFYSGHGNARDLEGLRKRFIKCDIYIPEISAWTEGALRYFRGVSAGKFNPKELTKDTNLSENTGIYKILQIIHKSNKPITIIDIPANPAIWKPNLIIPLDESFNLQLEDTFGRQLDSVRSLLQDEATYQDQREDHMISSLNPRVQELLEMHPSLKKKKNVRVLLSLGAVHTSLYHTLKKYDSSIIRTMDRMPVAYNFDDEGVRRYMFGKEVDDNLAARVFLEGLFLHSVIKISLLQRVNSMKIVDLKRKVISEFSFEEAKEIFKKLKQGESVWQLFETKFAEKGIKIPSSEKELDEFLAKPLPRSDTVKE